MRACRAILLLSCLLAAAGPAAEFAGTATNNTVVLTHYTGRARSVAVPAEIDGLPVTSIGNMVWSARPGLTNVIIPASVTNISRIAFVACYALAAITVDRENRVYTSVEGVLFDKSARTLLLCPPGKAGNFRVPDGVVSIGDGAFLGASKLSGITLPGAVTRIGDSAFLGCHALTNLTIPPSATNIGGHAFHQCQNLATVTLPEGLDRIENCLFLWCDRLAAITIPRSVTNIGWSAFSRCTNLVQLAIPDRVTSIGFEAFKECSRLARVVMPDSVTSIGKEAFAGCTSLDRVVLPKGLTNLEEKVFAGCAGLTSVTLPDSLPILGEHVFAGCGLTQVTVPAGVRDIWRGAFGWCTNLASVTIPNAAISDAAFNGCTRLTNVTLGKGVSDVAPLAFVQFDRPGCTRLVAFAVDPDNPAYRSVGGALFDRSGTALVQWPPGREGRCVLPAGVTSIRAQAFRSRSGLTGVTIPAGVTNIGLAAFASCANLTNVNIPNGITRIEPETFRDCTNITTLILPASVTTIGHHAFQTPGLRDVYFEGNAPKLGSGVFADSPSLTIHYRAGARGWGPTFGGRRTAVWKP